MKTLLLPRLSAEDLEATITLQDGRLDLTPITAAVGGGDLEAEFHLVSGPRPQIRTHGQVHRLDMTKMLDALGLPPSLQGKIGFQFDIEGAGASPAELAGAVDGSFSLALQDGRIASELVDQAGAYDFELTDAFTDLLKPAGKGEKAFVDIKCAVCRFAIDDGRAQSEVLVYGW